MTTTGGVALRSRSSAARAAASPPSISTRWSWTILTTIWPGVTERMTSCADRLRPHRVDELADDRQRHVGFEQRHADLAQRGVDIGLGQRAAPAQPVEDVAQTFAQTVEHVDPQATPKRQCAKLADRPALPIWEGGTHAAIGALRRPYSRPDAASIGAGRQSRARAPRRHMPLGMGAVKRQCEAARSAARASSRSQAGWTMATIIAGIAERTGRISPADLPPEAVRWARGGDPRHWSALTSALAATAGRMSSRRSRLSSVADTATGNAEPYRDRNPAVCALAMSGGNPTGTFAAGAALRRPSPPEAAPAARRRASPRGP